MHLKLTLKTLIQQGQKLNSNLNILAHIHLNKNTSVQKQSLFKLQVKYQNNQMAQKILEKLSNQYNFSFDKIDDLKIGYNLIKIALKLLYSDQDQILETKLEQINPSLDQKVKNVSPLNKNKAGNNVIIINTLLKRIKSDPNLKIQNWIRQITFYNILEDEQLLCKLIGWMMEINEQSKDLPNLKKQIFQDYDQQQDKNKNKWVNEEQLSSNRFREIKMQNMRFKTEQPERQQNDLQNLYFASNIKEKLNQDSKIFSPEKGDKIVRKGSFKLLKPKVSFSEGQNSSQLPKQIDMKAAEKVNMNLIQQVDLKITEKINRKNSDKLKYLAKTKYSKNNQINEPEQLNQISMIQTNLNHQNQINLSQQENIYGNQNQKDISIFQTQNKKLNSQKSFISNKNEIETENRKSITKNLSKPPLYRSSSIKNKQNVANMSLNVNANRNTFLNGNLQNLGNQKERKNPQSVKKKQFFNFSQSQNEDISHINFQPNQSTDRFQKQIYSRSQNYPHSLNEQMNFYLAQNDSLHEIKKKLGSGVQKPQYINKKTTYQQNDLQQRQKQQVQILTQTQLSKNERNHQNRNRKVFQTSKILQLKNNCLQKDIYILDQEIQKEKSQLEIVQLQDKQLNKSSSTHKRTFTSKVNSRQSIFKDNQNQSIHNKKSQSNFSSTKSARKVSKITLTQINQEQKYQIIQWLNRIHILQETKFDFFETVKIFSNGVKFVEICNYYIGRGKNLSFFNNPHKNAEIHSNFTKVFEYLKTLPEFSQKHILLHQLFVPVSQQNAIWNILLATHNAFVRKSRNSLKKSANKNSSLIYSKQNETRQRIQQFNEQFPQKQSQNRYGNSTSREKSKRLSSSKQNLSSKRPTSYNTPIMFVKEVPQQFHHKDLIQNIQPQNYDNQYQTKSINENFQSEGYKQRYLRKTLLTSNSKQKNAFSSLQTPKKNQIQIQSNYLKGTQALIKSNLRNSSSKKSLQKQLKKMQQSSHKVLSSRKSLSRQNKIIIPKVTLNMQMKINKLLKHFNLIKLLTRQNELSEMQLFNDPIRNGILINLVYRKIYQNQNQYRYFTSPKSISSCKQNYLIFLQQIKNKYGYQGSEFYKANQPLIDLILKGQKSLFYALTYSFIQILQEKGQKIDFNTNKQNLQTQNYQNSNRLIKQKIVSMKQHFQKNNIQWIRFLQRTYPRISELRIRNQNQFKQSISSGIIFYYFSENNTIRPPYIKPNTLQQRQSNLKKIIGYLIQNGIIFSKNQQVNIKFLAQSNSKVLKSVIDKLINFTLNRAENILETYDFTVRSYQNKKQSIENMTGSVSLGKYLQQSQNNGKVRLETTNAEYDNEEQIINKSSEDMQIEIPWLRKLGFSNCALKINNGILLCRLVSKLSRVEIKFNQNLATDARISKPQSLGNIRKALKLIPGIKFDQIDVYEANSMKSIQILQSIKERFRNTYEMTKILNSR